MATRATEFRRMALSFPESSESVHMGHPDFRVRGKIFATLAYPDENFGVVKLAPAQQEEFMREEPATFTPAAGTWGKRGYTQVHLRRAKKKTLQAALTAAWRNTAPPALLRSS